MQKNDGPVRCILQNASEAFDWIFLCVGCIVWVIFIGMCGGGVERGSP